MLFVVPIQRIAIEVENQTTPVTPTERELFIHRTPPADLTVQQILFKEGSHRIIRCVAEGGYPPPTLAVFVGEREITEEFQLTHQTSLYGSRGFRMILYQTERRCDWLSFTPLDDNQPIECVATVPGFASNHSKVIINVLCKYTILKCNDRPTSYFSGAPN